MKFTNVTTYIVLLAFIGLLSFGIYNLATDVTNNDNANLEDARVFLEPSDGTGDLVFEAAISGITRSGTVATATATGHGLSVGDDIVISCSYVYPYSVMVTVCCV